MTRLNLVRRPMLNELSRQLETAPAPKVGYVVTRSGSGDAVGYGYGYPYGGDPYGRPEKVDRVRVVKDGPQPNPAVTVVEADRR